MPATPLLYKRFFTVHQVSLKTKRIRKEKKTYYPSLFTFFSFLFFQSNRRFWGKRFLEECYFDSLLLTFVLYIEIETEMFVQDFIDVWRERQSRNIEKASRWKNTISINEIEHTFDWNNTKRTHRKKHVQDVTILKKRNFLLKKENEITSKFRGKKGWRINENGGGGGNLRIPRSIGDA